jgi:hypothetical protein
VASFGSWLAIPLIILGIILHQFALAKLGVILFAAIVVFQIVTLPVEFNASSRARKALASTGIIVTEEEAAGVRSVLGAAALTYVAAAVVAIAQLLYFLIQLGLLGGSED